MWSPDQVRSFCINLDRRPERWEAVTSQAETKRIPNFTRVSAVDGKTLDAATDPRISTLCRYNIKEKTRRSHDLLDSIGGVGCALSHINLWNKLVAGDDPVYLIIEDDIVIPAGFWDTVQKLFAERPSLADSTSWDIWSIGALHCFPQIGVKPADRFVVENKWMQCTQFVGLQAYFISRTGAEKLLKDVFPIQHHIDWFITLYAQTKPFKIIHNKLLNCKQRGSQSDIAEKARCVICDVPTKVETSHYVVPMEAANTVLLVGACLAVVAWMAMRRT